MLLIYNDSNLDGWRLSAYDRNHRPDFYSKLIFICRISTHEQDKNIIQQATIINLMMPIIKSGKAYLLH